ncbi:MAG: radical SAM protein [Elusimicrobia bacterium]|nr:radical SAM protein [Elusimicrobiota bacterium]
MVRAGLGQRLPLVVSWRLLNRCNLRCDYCHIPMVPTEELRTPEILAVIDDLKAAGARYLHFTGGEVLLRNDIDVILGRAADLGVDHSVNSNGSFVPEKIALFRRGTRLNLSLDGDESVHDAARGPGTHRQVMAALEAAFTEKVKVALTAVLSSKNLQAIDWLFETAARYRAKISFQPARLERLGSSLPDPITPPPWEYRRVMERLIEEKRRGNPWLMNSITGLRHLAAFPKPRPIPCQAGKLYFRIEANGDLLACPNVPRPVTVYNIRQHGLAKALALTTCTGCHQCWCAGQVDFNYAAALDVGAVANMIRAH